MLISAEPELSFGYKMAVFLHQNIYQLRLTVYSIKPLQFIEMINGQSGDLPDGAVLLVVVAPDPWAIARKRRR